MLEQIKHPTTRNGKATFNLILRAAEMLFLENGYHKTTVADITKKAGVAAGTFYLYFPSKISLYQHLLLDISHTIRKEIASRIKEKDSRRDKEKEGIKAFLEYAIKNPHMYNIIWESFYIDRALFREYYESFSKRYVKGLLDAQTNGEVADVDLEIVSYILMGITNFVGLKLILDLGDHPHTVDKVVETIIDILDHGLFQQKTAP